MAWRREAANRVMLSLLKSIPGGLQVEVCNACLPCTCIVDPSSPLHVPVAHVHACPTSGFPPVTTVGRSRSVQTPSRLAVNLKHESVRAYKKPS